MDYSVIIPTFNSQKYLVETLNSVLRQTVRPKEIIICDNGSTDLTMNMIESLAKPVIVTTESTKGPGPARNKAVSLATSEIVAFIDSDDLWHPKKMEYQLPYFKDADLVYTYFRLAYPGKIIAQPQKPVDHSKAHILYSDNYIGTSSVAIKKDVFQRLGGFDPAIRVSEDWDLWLRVIKSHRITCCPFELVDKREHDENITRNTLLMYRGISQTLKKNAHLVNPINAFMIKLKYLKQYVVTGMRSGRLDQAMKMITS
jgi:glycosyltransferase involved in cell wall biosynthesis